MKHTLQNLGQNFSEQLGKLYSFKDKRARYRKHYLPWDNIERANQNINAVLKKSFVISGPANRLLSAVIAKLLKEERVILNHKYISTFTLVERRQNVRIIQELGDILDITYHRSVTHDGKKYRYSYEFSYKHSNPQKTTSAENCVGTFMSQHNDLLFIDKENKNIEDIDLKSNFLQNSKHSICNQKIIRRKKRARNERKKTTHEKCKAKIYHFNQYKEPQDLKYHYPLSNDDNSKLQSLSGRDFSLNAMNEILLYMSRKLDRRFCSKAQFIGYFAKCLKFEIRDSFKTGNDNFYIKTHTTNDKRKKSKIINELKVKAYDLDNRTTNGFQKLSVLDIFDKLQFRN